MGLGFWELTVIFGIIFFLFGRNKVPGFIRTIKKTTEEFKNGLSGDEIDVTEASRKANAKKNNNKES
jgi:TatA/E family protein of Tat protein translocase